MNTQKFEHAKDIRPIMLQNLYYQLYISAVLYPHWNVNTKSFTDLGTNPIRKQVVVTIKKSVWMIVSSLFFFFFV